MDDTTPLQRPDLTGRPRRWPNVLLLVASLLWLVALALVVAVGAYRLRYADRIYPGVWVAHVDLGGLTQDQAEATLQSASLALPLEPVAVRYGDHRWRISPEELSIALDAESTVDRAYQIGRGESILAELREQIQLYRQPRVVEPVFTLFDDGFLAYSLALIAQEINSAAREATLIVDGLDVKASAGQSGREVDQGATLATLEQRFLSGGGGEVELVVRLTEPVLDDLSEGEALLKQALGSPLRLDYQGEVGGRQEFVIERETLAEWLQWHMDMQPDGRPAFTVNLDEDSVKGWVEELAAELYRGPQDATFEFDEDTLTLVPVEPSVWGQELDQTETVQRILEQATTDRRLVPLPVHPIKPDLAMEDAPEMGVKELVAQASTQFAGSSAARVHNIERAASQFQDVLVPPGGIFSFNEHLGEVAEETGYEESLIIWGDSTAVGIGGGVCQVSTTAFRAALLGGFPIVERYAHGYLVSWYGQPGMDATVYAPHVDLKFRNDSEYWLVIESDVDTVAGSITFSFYGTDTGRTVEIIAGEPENVADPPAPVYMEDPELAAGAIKQVDWAVRGMDVTITRTVQLEGELLYEDTFFSSYQPWSAKYRYGTGVVVPEGAVNVPAPTPTPSPDEITEED